MNREAQMENSPVARAPYGRLRDLTTGAQPSEQGAPSSPATGYRGETYYDEAVLNPSHYGELVAVYLFIGGVAGASEVIATIADLCGHEQSKSIVRSGRYLALGGAIAGPVFLIADLETPERWYNMLRIFRRTSPMSIGSWTLASFGVTSAVAAAAEFAAAHLGHPRLRRIARLAGFPAAAAGALVATYTGTLLGATSTPLWAAVGRRLPVVFGISAAVTASSALLLIGHMNSAAEQATRPLERLARIMSRAELLASRWMESEWDRRGVAGPLKEEPMAAAYRLGYKGLGIAAPLILHAVSQITGRRGRRWSVAAALATLAGGFIFRSIMIQAGKQSARRPQDYFHMTQAKA
jgi:formate-dependent nitrite reductase membrane component NrfD